MGSGPYAGRLGVQGPGAQGDAVNGGGVPWPGEQKTQIQTKSNVTVSSRHGRVQNADTSSSSGRRSILCQQSRT